MSSNFAYFVTHAKIETASRLSGMTWWSVSLLGFRDDAAFIRVQLRDNRQKRDLVSPRRFGPQRDRGEQFSEETMELRAAIFWILREYRNTGRDGRLRPVKGAVLSAAESSK
jgi:hypothetical protein